MATVNEFLKLLYDQVGRGIYVWGGDGELLDKMQHPVEWIERHEASANDASRAVKLYRKRVAGGISDIRAFDCSGLVYWALHTLGLQKTDVSSRGLYGLCEKINKSELRPGDLVFHHNGIRIVHVGVWANDGNQIECRGRDVGVVCNKRSSGYWNRFGRWKGFSPDPAPTPTPKTVYVKGGSVNVRSGDTTKASIIGVAHRKDTYTLLGYGASGWYMINFKGAIGYISNRADLTELR